MSNVVEFAGREYFLVNEKKFGDEIFTLYRTRDAVPDVIIKGQNGKMYRLHPTQDYHNEWKRTSLPKRNYLEVKNASRSVTRKQIKVDRNEVSKFKEDLKKARIEIGRKARDKYIEEMEKLKQEKNKEVKPNGRN